MDVWQLHNEFERIWKEMITVRLEVAFAICLEGVNKITKTIRTADVKGKSDHSACAEFRKEALPLSQPCHQMCARTSAARARNLSHVSPIVPSWQARGFSAKTLT